MTTPLPLHPLRSRIPRGGILTALACIWLVATAHAKTPQGTYRECLRQLDAAVRAARTAATPAERAACELTRLQALQHALTAMRDANLTDPALTARYKKEIVFSEPSGQWLVRGDALWALRERFAAQPSAEAIAWAAARQPLAGECETDASCHLMLLKLTYGRYLSLYPSGPHAAAALSAMRPVLDSLASDANDVFAYPTGTRDETAATLSFLRRVVTASTPPARSGVLERLSRIEARMKAAQTPRQ